MMPQNGDLGVEFSMWIIQGWHPQPSYPHPCLGTLVLCVAELCVLSQRITLHPLGLRVTTAVTTAVTTPPLCHPSCAWASCSSALWPSTCPSPSSGVS